MQNDIFFHLSSSYSRVYQKLYSAFISNPLPIFFRILERAVFRTVSDIHQSMLTHHALSIIVSLFTIVFGFRMNTSSIRISFLLRLSSLFDILTLSVYGSKDIFLYDILDQVLLVFHFEFLLARALTLARNSSGIHGFTM